MPNLGIPLLYVPEAPKLKKTWVTYDFRWTLLHGVDEESNRLIVHWDFSQVLAHAPAEQSMYEYFDVIASSLFIAIAHYWDPVTKQRECEGTPLPSIQSFIIYLFSKHGMNTSYLLAG